METNKDLFWKLLEAHHPKAEAFCRRLLPDGDDLYHDALLAAWRKFDSLRDISSFKPWLYKIIVNLYKSRRRSFWHRLAEPLANAETEVLPSFDPSSQIAAGLLVKKGLATLSPPDRALVILFEIEGWSVAELAQLEGKPEGTIKARLSRSRAAMKKRILDNLPNNEINWLKKEAKYVSPET